MSKPEDIRSEITWNPAEHTDVDARMAQMADMRARCPVGFTNARAPHWTVSRYKDLQQVALDADTYSNAGAPRFGRPLPPLEVDPPVHGLYRAALQKFFLPSRVRALEPVVLGCARQLLAPILSRGGGDLVREFANPLPVYALCAILGLDPSRWEDLKRLGELQLGIESPDPEEQATAQDAHTQLMTLAEEVIAERRRHPREPGEDVVATFLAMEVDGKPLDDGLIAGMIRLFISAGHNSTTNALGNMLLYLARNSDAQSALRADPSGIPVAVEELLRFESPVQEMFRWATCDSELGGQAIGAGDRVGLLWGSGNRDEAIFPEADRCLLDRRPNRHLAFGYGIHTCLGAPVARMELRVALSEILQQSSNFALAGEVLRKPFHHMGVYRLPISIER
jgi:cytochrome P450 family 130